MSISRTNALFRKPIEYPVSLRVAGHTTWYVSPEKIQRDLDKFLTFYNLKRSHQGYRLKGRTPAQALCEALGRKRLPPIVPKEDMKPEKDAA